MEYVIGVCHTNRFDLTVKTLESLAPIAKNVVIVDNSNNLEVYHHYKDKGFNIHIPDSNVFFTQFQNLIIKIALERGCDWYGFMHDDAWTNSTDDINVIVNRFNELHELKRYGIIKTNYDALCAISMDAVVKTGWWDNSYVQYFSDNDYYHRLFLAGYPDYCATDLAPLVLHPQPSRTIRSDKLRSDINGVIFPAAQQLFGMKWGSTKTRDKLYNMAYNNKDLHDKERNAIKEWVSVCPNIDNRFTK